MSKVKQTLTSHFEKYFNTEVTEIKTLPASGSSRLYYRIIGDEKSAIGTFNKDYKENLAFIIFSKHFKNLGLPVPKIYVEDLSQHVYLQEDFGDTTLFNLINENRTTNEFSENLKRIYFAVLDNLIFFQTKANQHLDYSVCYPRNAFDKQSMLWDLNYFKYYFLKLAEIPFDEQLLEDDFKNFSDYLLKAPSDFFMYRDFQSRNIMIRNNKPYFIDYQGGRKGALQYDVASLLFDAKADLSQKTRDEFLEYYIDKLSKHISIDKNSFLAFYHGFVLIRIMQAMGAYGYRGFYERKLHFLKSIPYALINLKYILEQFNLPVKVPHLLNVLDTITRSEKLMHISQKEKEKLHVEINSFSYKKGIPADLTEHGGGFVFDCRSINNPGRIDKYKHLTGKDEAVQKFFTEQGDMKPFLKSVFQLVDNAVNKYLMRKFTHLQINFGCTGGQHRSVYAAEELAAHLKEKFDVVIELNHRHMPTEA